MLGEDERRYTAETSLDTPIRLVKQVCCLGDEAALEPAVCCSRNHLGELPPTVRFRRSGPTRIGAAPAKFPHRPQSARNPRVRFICLALIGFGLLLPVSLRAAMIAA